MNISPISAFSDNYIWCLHVNDQAWVVDPGCAESVEDYLAHNNLTLQGIIITHHHADHTGGIKALAEHRDLTIFGPENCLSKGVKTVVANGDQIEVLGTSFKVMEIPGHTLDHIAYFSSETKTLFCGDTLFSAGCGRIFEGTATMMWQSLSSLASLPTDTNVYCAHEYTTSNLHFAVAVDTDNQELQKRVLEVQNLRANDLPSIPTTIGLELATNPFLRAAQPALKRTAEGLEQEALSSSEDVFRALRAYKDRF